MAAISKSRQASAPSLLLLVLAVCHILNAALASVDYYPPGITAAELLRRRGFQAEELFVNTTDGYVLRITKGRNPLINGGHLDSKDPILFVHGIKSTANNFLLNSFNVRPKDFTDMSVSSQSLDELTKRLEDEPSARALPLLALNLGHEVWLLDRRGRPGSQQLVGDLLSIKATPSSQSGPLISSLMRLVSGLFSPTLFIRQAALTYDREFWNFSLDEQARVDFPQTIDFILNHSPYAKRVAVVGHSAGAALPLMALSLYPAEMSRKLSSCILWSPAFAKGCRQQDGNDNDGPDINPMKAFVGPIPAPYRTNFYQAIRMLTCGLAAVWTRLGRSEDSRLGHSGDQQPMRAQFYAGDEFSTSSRELAQVEQASLFPPNRTMHFFDHGLQGNLAAYGHSAPPSYDLSALRNFPSLSFYAAATDLRVTPADVQMTRSLLTVPSRYHLINGTFNHNGYFFHLDAPKMAIIRSMRELETMK